MKLKRRNEIKVLSILPLKTKYFIWSFHNRYLMVLTMKHHFLEDSVEQSILLLSHPPRIWCTSDCTPMPPSTTGASVLASLRVISSLMHIYLITSLYLTQSFSTADNGKCHFYPCSTPVCIFTRNKFFQIIDERLKFEDQLRFFHWQKKKSYFL